MFELCEALADAGWRATGGLSFPWSVSTGQRSDKDPFKAPS
jgi:hypothetical protein